VSVTTSSLSTYKARLCDVPGQPWVVDISYMDTAEGWSYLAVILIQPSPFLVLALSVDLRIMSVIILTVIILTVFFFTK